MSPIRAIHVQHGAFGSLWCDRIFFSDIDFDWRSASSGGTLTLFTRTIMQETLASFFKNGLLRFSNQKYLYVLALPTYPCPWGIERKRVRGSFASNWCTLCPNTSSSPWRLVAVVCSALIPCDHQGSLTAADSPETAD